MRHDYRAYHASADSPTGCPAVLLFLVCIQILNVKRFREVLPQVVRGAGLERAFVTHHRLDGIGSQRAGKLFAVAFPTGDDRNRGFVHREVSVDVKNAEGFLFRFGVCGVRRMAFLPEKFHRPEEKTGTQLPPYHVCPLVDKHRQVAVGLDPLAIHIADDSLRGGTND